MFCYLWDYIVRPERLEEFRAGYGTEGEWVRLFRRDPEYIRTHLLTDCDDPLHFMTIDIWSSREARDALRERYPEEFDAIDRRYQSCTVRETHLGDFDGIAEGGNDAPPRPRFHQR